MKTQLNRANAIDFNCSKPQMRHPSMVRFPGSKTVLAGTPLFTKSMMFALLRMTTSASYRPSASPSAMVLPVLASTMEATSMSLNVWLCILSFVFVKCSSGLTGSYYFGLTIYYAGIEEGSRAGNRTRRISVNPLSLNFPYDVAVNVILHRIFRCSVWVRP